MNWEPMELLHRLQWFTVATAIVQSNSTGIVFRAGRVMSKTTSAGEKKIVQTRQEYSALGPSDAPNSNILA